MLRRVIAATGSCATQLRLMATQSEHGPIGQTIQSKLLDAFKPSHLLVINESYMHNVPKGSETHFKVVVVADAFEGLKVIQRHRSINDVLASELEHGVHALSIAAKTPAQWETSSGAVSESPKCLGGNKL
eukprot:m.22271 g.22271  ORF g.22271 m.22271 type:complete len:130 (-) comp11226_c0_seq2:165-554(-)